MGFFSNLFGGGKQKGNQYAQIADDYRIAEGGYSGRAAQYIEGITDPDLLLTQQAQARIRGLGREAVGTQAGEVWQRLSSPMFSRTSAGRAQLASMVGKTQAQAAYNLGQTEMGIEREQMGRQQQMFQNKGTLAELRLRGGQLMQGMGGAVSNIGLAGQEAKAQRSAGMAGLAASAIGTIGGFMLGGPMGAAVNTSARPSIRYQSMPSTSLSLGGVSQGFKFGTGTGSGTMTDAAAVDTASLKNIKRYGKGTTADAFIVGDDPTGQGRENQELVVRDGDKTHVVPINGSRYAPVMMFNGDIDSPMVRGGRQRKMMDGMGMKWRPNRNDVTRGRRDED